MLQIQSASLSDTGRKRRNNEDFVASFEPEDSKELNISGCLYIVADGVGGAIKGEKASRYASQKVLFEYYRHPELHPTDRLQVFMRQAGNEIFNYAQENHESRMATTMVVAAIKADVLTIANVGDSRAYLIRGENIQQITRDHSLVGEMVREGLISENDSHQSKVKNLLTRSLGGELDVHPDIFPDIHLLPGDRILLCTDGLTRYAGYTDLYELIQQGTPGEVVNKLIDFANHKGGADNISAVLIKVGEQVNGKELINIKPSQKPRDAVNWENMPTLVNIEMPQKKTTSDNQRRYLIWGGLTIALLLVLGSMAIWIPKLPGFGVVKITSTPSAIPTEANSTLIPNPIIETTIYPTISVTEELLEQAETFMPITTDEEARATTYVPDVTKTAVTPETPTCIFKTRNPDFGELSTILEQFNVDYIEGSSYYYYECDESHSPIICGDRTKIPNNNLIQVGWWIEILDPKKDCIASGGKYMYVP